MSPIAQTAAVQAPAPQRVERTRFCTHCGALSAEAEPQGLPFGFDRVCDRCGMGVMLTAPRRALPGAGAAFLVVTREGRISAVSEPAEELVGEEAGLLGVPLSTTVTCPDGDGQFARMVARAAGGAREISDAIVVPAPQGGNRPVRLSVRVASCGPPRAALLVLQRAPL